MDWITLDGVHLVPMAEMRSDASDPSSWPGHDIHGYPCRVAPRVLWNCRGEVLGGSWVFFFLFVFLAAELHVVVSCVWCGVWGLAYHDAGVRFKFARP